MKKYFEKDRELKYKFIQNDIDKLKLKFSGKKFIDKLNSKMDLKN
mgnify:CR=1 FL=1